MSSLTFTRTTQEHDRETDLVTSTESTIAGRAIRIRGNPTEYELLDLRVHEAVTVSFIPSAYATEEPRPGDATTWQGAPAVVRQVFPTSPDGYLIRARVILQLLGGAT